MSYKEESSEDVCNNFGQLYWHDSRIINLHLLKDSANRKYNLELDVDLFEKNLSGKLERKGKTIIFKECRIVQLDFDILGLLFCNGDISNAVCYKDAVKLENEKRGKLKHFDFPDTFNPLEKCLGFSIEMIHPAGEILIFARTFEVHQR